MYPQEEAGFLCGVIFGVCLVVSLVVTGVLRNPITAVLLVVVSAAAYVAAYLTAFGMQLHHPELVAPTERWDMGTPEPAGPIALFAGGLVGGFLLFLGVDLLCQRVACKPGLVKRVLLGALLGGLLGVVAWALRSSVGVAIWNLMHAFGFVPRWEIRPQTWFHGEYDYGQRTRMYSLYLVWQTGIATVIGLMLRHVPIPPTADETGSRLFKSR